MSASPLAPDNYLHPEWDKATRVHDWRNYVSAKMQRMWDTFTDDQKLAIAESAEEHANGEEWE